jgi:hypothetical protein
MGISSLAGLGDVEVKLSAIVGRTEVTFEEAVNLRCQIETLPRQGFE